jgi:hypothetical protein
MVWLREAQIRAEGGYLRLAESAEQSLKAALQSDVLLRIQDAGRKVLSFVKVISKKREESEVKDATAGQPFEVEMWCRQIGQPAHPTNPRRRLLETNRLYKYFPTI